MSGRTRAVLAAVGLVALGFALGVFADHLWLAHRIHASAPEPTHAEAVVAMLGSLDLTDEQRAAVNEVLQRYHEKVERHLAEIHPVLLSTMDSGRQEIEALLTPDQRGQFHDWLRTERERLHSVPDFLIRH